LPVSGQVDALTFSHLNDPSIVVVPRKQKAMFVRLGTRVAWYILKSFRSSSSQPMKPHPRNAVASWAEWGEVIRELLSREKNLAQRPYHIAELLARMVGGARYTSCQFGEMRAEIGEHHDQETPGKTFQASFRDPLAGAGCLEVGLPADTDEGEEAALEAYLQMAAQLLDRELHLQAMTAERDDSQDVATAGEAILGMLHTLNNHLNSMILQTAAVQMRMTDPIKSDLQNVRREGAEAAARLRPLQSVREVLAGRGTSDLNLLIVAVLREQSTWSHRITTDLGELPSLNLPAPALIRVLRLLYRVTLSSRGASGTVPLRTWREDGKVCLTFDVEGVRLPVETSSRLIDLPLNLTSGAAELERIAAQSLLRRLEAELTLTSHNGGTVVCVTWRTC
jgi:hypothetical protein